MPGVSSPSWVAPSDLAGPCRITCRLASTEADLEAHLRLRRDVFVHEQALFVEDDRDERDEQASTLHAIGLVDDRPRGAVRLYPLDPEGRMWKGDRLAVMPEHRANHLGAKLVRFAVATGGSLGGCRMIAHVQLPNVRFFERLGWVCDDAPAQFHGVPHQLMSIGLGQRSSV